MGIKTRGLKRTKERLLALADEEQSLVSKDGARILKAYLRRVSPVDTGHMKSTLETRRKGARWIVAIPQARYTGWFYAVKFARFFRRKARQFKKQLVKRVETRFKRRVQRKWQRG